MVDNLFHLRRADLLLSRNIPVVARWTSNGFSYQAKGSISALALDHVIVTLAETVGSNTQFRPGKQIRIPRFADQTRWSSRNCVQLINRNESG